MSMYIGGDKIDALYVKKTLSPGDTISYNDLTDKPFIPTAVTDLSDASNYALKTDIQTYTAGTGINITNGVISNTQTSAEWGNITGVLSTQSDLQSALDSKIDGSSLATVATSGDYDDLVNKPTMPIVDQTYNASSSNAQSGVAIAGAKFVQNTATVSTSLTLLGTPTNKLNAINIGGSSSVRDSASIAIGGASTAALYGISIGYSAYGSKLGSIALGSFSYATAIGAIQLAAIGNNQNVNATNSEAGSFYVALYDGDSTSGNYKLLGADGKIPDDRLNTTIARTSDYYTKAEVDAMIGNIEAILQRLNSGNNS